MIELLLCIGASACGLALAFLGAARGWGPWPWAYVSGALILIAAVALFHLTWSLDR